MTYSKAYKGIKKLFVAGILSLVGSVCVWLAAVPGILGVSAALKGSIGGFFAGGLGTVLLLLAGLLLPIIAYIMKLVGLEQARHDEPQFYQGFLFAILALIFVVLEAVFSALSIGGGIVEGIVGTVYGVLDVVVTVYVICGIQNLAGKLEESKMVQKGTSLVKYITVFYAVSLFAVLISVLFGTSMVMQVLAGILSFIASILNLIVYIIYLVYLGRAKKMLKSSKEIPSTGNVLTAEAISQLFPEQPENDINETMH